jgi:MoxR-like ATPase
MKPSTTVWLQWQEGKTIDLPEWAGLPAQAHVLERDAVYAINAALAAGRPLLVRGEPGTGKSQLARAAAVELRRCLVQKVIDARTESNDLLYQFDAIGRLAEAQVQGAGKRVDEKALDEKRFLRPGPLWWAFDDEKAQKLRNVQPPPVPHQDCSASNGWVVLLDEIDKADTDVPNGLLEALGSGCFEPPGFTEPIHHREATPAPLVVITTNEERALPDAFLRRCVVLHLELPAEGLVPFLVGRGRAHFPDLPEPVLALSAEMLQEDRDALRGRGHALPGQAEYLDLVRAVARQRDNEKSQLELLREVRKFVYSKHPRTDSA